MANYSFWNYSSVQDDFLDTLYKLNLNTTASFKLTHETLIYNYMKALWTTKVMPYRDETRWVKHMKEVQKEIDEQCKVKSSR